MEQKKGEEKAGQIKVVYMRKHIKIEELMLDLEKATFGDIIEYFNYNVKFIYPYFKLKSLYFFNGKKLENSQKIRNLIAEENFDKNQLKLEVWVDEIYKINDENFQNYYKIIIPNKTKTSLELYVYFPSKGVIDIEEYNDNIYEEYSLEKINSKTAFCNTNHYLLLSGGEFNGEIIDNAWLIKNSDYSIKNLKLPSAKSGHTMLPIDNNYIAIAGGNDKITYLYHIETNEFRALGKTNYLHTNPVLFFWKNYIYCFSELNKEIIAEKFFFSDDDDISWESIPLNFINQESITSIDNENYSNENILVIVGGQKNIEYIPKKETAIILKSDSLSGDMNFDINPCDKNFYKVSQFYSVYIPDNFDEEKQLIVVNKKYRHIHKMKFSDSTDTGIKIKYQFKGDDAINFENSIILKIDTDAEQTKINGAVQEAPSEEEDEK